MACAVRLKPSLMIDGTFAWTDFAYDDRGPNTDNGDRTDIASAGGDAVYVDGLANAADFVQVQLRESGGGLHIRVVLETLLDPAVPLVGIAFDTDHDSATGAGVIHDLAFVANEPFYQWQDYRQADILSAKAPVEPAFVAIDFGRLTGGTTELPDATAVGFHTYLYHSNLKLAEGIVQTADGPEFLGPYQPYLVYVPVSGYQPGEAMTKFLHGLTQNHLGSVNLGDVYLGTGRVLSEEIGALEQFVRDGTNFPPYNLTVWPLARGAGLI